MGALPGWFSILFDRLNWGCTTSPWFVDLADEKKVLQRGRQIVIDLWPFIRELPVNIAAVRDAVPKHMTAACNLLSRLSDDERQYQRLFIQQFQLAELTFEQLETYPVNSRTQKLCEKMSEMCQRRTFADGVHAIVVAELVATMYARSSLPLYENYMEKHVVGKKYSREEVDAGLEWLRLHAKTHTRHAIWMKRMLADIEDESGNEMPEGAAEILDRFLEVWECPSEPNISELCHIS